MARTKAAAVKATGTPAAEIAADVLALPVYEEEVRGGGRGRVKALDSALGGNLAAAAKAERFAGKPGQELALPTLGRTPAGRVLLVGMGPRAKAKDWAGAGFEPLRSAAGRAARAAAKAGARALAVALPEEGVDDVAAAARAVAEGALLGAYAFARYKSEEDDRRTPLAELTIAVPAGAERRAEVKGALALAREIAGAVGWARDLVNLGPADCTPSLLAEQAVALAREAKLAVEVRGPKEIAALRMGMFLGVTRGSSEPPRLVTVSYVPEGRGGEEGAGGARRQGHHLRLGRPLAQADREHGDDEHGHGGLRRGPRRDARHRRPRAAVPGARGARRLREHAGRAGLQAVRRARLVRGQDGRDHEHRRGGAARARRRARLGGGDA